MKFKKEILQAIVYDDCMFAKKIGDVITGTAHWSIIRKMVFKYKDKFYQSTYAIGAMEMQKERPYEYSADEIECPEVEQKEVMVKKWVLVKEDKFHIKEEEYTKCERCGGTNGKHKQVDDPMAGNSHMLTKMQCPNDNDEKRPLSYGIAQSDGKGGFGFWDGPNPSLEEILEVDGHDENSVIWRFNEDGTDDLIYKWGGDEWVKVGEIL